MQGTVKRAAVIVAVVAICAAAIAAPASAQGDPQRGRDVFEQSCAMCHGQDASGMMDMHPSLRGAVERLSREGVDITIRAGRDTIPPMPSFEGQLSETEIEDVVAYLDTLPVGPRNFGPGDDDGMMDGMMEGGMWTWLLWSILFLVVLAAVVVGVIFAVRSQSTRGATESSPDRALEILKERYARGEVDRQEFEERRSVLEERL
jgi:putative membrane protein